MKKFVDPRIVRDIERKVDYLAGMNLLYGVLHRLHSKSLETEAIVHSYKIEHPELNGNSRHNTHIGKRKLRKGIKQLGGALKWGYDNFSIQGLNQGFIKDLARRVDPVFHKKGARYREMGVRPTGATWTPPYPTKLKVEMRRFCRELRAILIQNTLDAMVEASAYAHLHLVRIHPFEDTNGRTARTLQNTILKSVDLPPPIIYVGERRDYYGKLDRAINGWRGRTGKVVEESETENFFYNYIAYKISCSLDRVIGTKH